MSEVRGYLVVTPGGHEVLIARGRVPEYTRGVAVMHTWADEEGRLRDDALEELVSEMRATRSAHRRESSDGATASEVYVATEGLDATVFASASATNARNQGLARLLQSFGRLYSDPEEAVDLYTRQCSLRVSAHANWQGCSASTARIRSGLPPPSPKSAATPSSTAAGAWPSSL